MPATVNLHGRHKHLSVDVDVKSLIVWAFNEPVPYDESGPTGVPPDEVELSAATFLVYCAYTERGLEGDLIGAGAVDSEAPLFDSWRLKHRDVETLIDTIFGD